MGDTYTQSSSNFADSNAGGVDPRTGIYSMSLLLANIKANGSSGPNFPISLQYDPMSSTDMGFGIGWGMSCTTIGRQNSCLVLATGEKYAIGAECKLRDQKIVTAQLETILDGYMMRHRNGDVWVLNKLVGDGVYVPSSILAPNGLSVQLDWLTSGELIAISDEIPGENGVPQKLLTIDRDVNAPNELDIGETETKITLWPGTNVKKEVKLIIRGKRLQRITIEDLTWKFLYNEKIDNSKNFYPLVEVFYPNGAHDIVTYTDMDKGHRYPDAAQTSHTVPYVTNYRRIIPGNDADRLVDYTYSPKNYLGYDSGITKWDSNVDNLYEASNEYDYWVLQTEYVDGKKIETTNHYNKFHLLVEMEVNNSDYIQKTTQSYDISNGNFSDQKVWFQQAQEIKVEYSRPGEPTYTEKTINTFDKYGNKASTLTPDGTLEEWEYYDAVGEGEDCPPAPLKIDTYLKSHKITAPQVAGIAKSQTRKKVTKYKSIDIGLITGNDDSPIQSVTVPINEDYSVDESKVYSVATTYHETTDRISLGRVATHETTLFDGKAEYKATTNMSYSLSDGGLTTTSKQTGFDQLSKESSATICAYSGSPIETKSPLGIKESYLYDDVGRIKSHKLCTDSVYLHETNFEYGVVPLDESDPKTLIRYMTRTDSNNVSYKQKYNGEGHPIHESYFSDIEDEYNLVSQSYDTLGRMKTVSKFDDVGKNGLFKGDSSKENGTTDSTEVWSTKELFYDNWGQQHRYSINSGVRGSSYYNPLTKNNINYLGDENQFSSIRSDYDVNYLPADIVTLDKDSNEVARKTVHCDGFGQVISHTDEIGNSASYKYDSFGRVVEATYAVGTDISAVVSKTYAPHSSESLVTSISVNGTEIGRQQFDGFDRLVSRTVGGREYRFEYSEDAASKPSLVTLPDGNKFTYIRVKELGEAPEKITASDGTYRKYEYDKVTGLPTVITQSLPKGTGEAMVITLTYTNRGMVRTKTIDNKVENKTYIVSYEYTIGGQLLSYTNPKGGATTFKYDEFGRQKVVSDSKSTTTFYYDSDIGLLTGWEVTSKNGTSTVGIEYDSRHRETKRTISDSATRKKLEISYKHNDIGLILSKNIITNEDQTGSMEDYTYDSRNRLIKVSYTGLSRPEDEDFGPIDEITYDYIKKGIGESIEFKTIRCGGNLKKYRYFYDNYDDRYQLTSMSLQFSKDKGTIYTITYYSYDLCGRLISATRNDHLSHEVFDYDAFGQLSGYSKNNGKLSSNYQYDGLGTLRVETDGSGGKRQFFYYNGKVSSEVVTQSGTEHFIGRTVSDHYYLSQYMDDEEPFRLGVDLNGSVLTASQSGGTNPCDYTYTPYGDRTGNGGQYLPGYNGEIIDHVTGCYHLGNGYRVYMPELMRFNKPDSESPFGRGGLNWYAYCEGDPVNSTDPTGHYRNHPTQDNTAAIVFSFLMGFLVIGASALLGGGSLSKLKTKGVGLMSTEEMTSAAFAGVSLLCEVGSAIMGIASAFLEKTDEKTAAILGQAAQMSTAIGTTATGISWGVKYKAKKALDKKKALAAEQAKSELFAAAASGGTTGESHVQAIAPLDPEPKNELADAGDARRCESITRSPSPSVMHPASNGGGSSTNGHITMTVATSGERHSLIIGTSLTATHAPVAVPPSPKPAVNDAQPLPAVVGVSKQIAHHDSHSIPNQMPVFMNELMNNRPELRHVTPPK